MRVYSFIQVLKSNVNFKESFNDAGQQQLTAALSNWKVKDILNNLPWYQKRVIFVASLCCHPALVNISWWPCYLTIFDNKSFSFNLRGFFCQKMHDSSWLFHGSWYFTHMVGNWLVSNSLHSRNCKMTLTLIITLSSTLKSVFITPWTTSLIAPSHKINFQYFTVLHFNNNRSL